MGWQKAWHLALLQFAALCIFATSANATSTGNLDGLLVHVVKPISADKILPDSSPLPGQKGTILKILAARGEYEPASFVLQSTTDIANLVLAPTQLTSTAGAIPAANIDIKVLKVWYQSYYAWRNIGKAAPDDFRQRLVPELLLNDDNLIRVDYAQERNSVRIDRGQGDTYVWINKPELHDKPVLPSLGEFPVQDAPTLQPFTLIKKKNKQIWVTIKVPENASEGLYTGKITLSAGDKNLGHIDVEVTVLPFALAKPAMTYSIYYRAVLDPSRASIGSEFKNLVQLRAELENMRNHGILNPTVYQPPDSGPLFESYLAEREAAAMTGAPLFLLGINTSLYVGTRESTDSLKLAVSAAKQIASQHGFTEIYIYGRDEASGDALLAEVPEYRAVHDAGARVFVAGHDGVFQLAGDYIDLFIDAWRPEPAEARLWHNEGKRIFSYANPQVVPENPLLFRRNYGVVAWAAGYDGVMDYAYQHSFGNIWNDLDHPAYRDHVIAYPTANGVIDTIAWEGFREAIDDVRYLTTLEKYANLARQSSDPKRRDTGKQADEFLSTLRATIKQKGGNKKYTMDFTVDLDDLRRQVIEFIKRLTVLEVEHPKNLGLHKSWK